MVHIKSFALAALATFYAVYATPVQVASENAVAARDNTPAPGQPFYNSETKSIEINRREALASPGEPYYNADTNSIEIDIPSSGGSNDKRSAQGGPPGPRPLVRIYYDQIGRIRAVAQFTGATVVQTAFESVRNEILNIASDLAREIGWQGEFLADYNPNEDADTVTVGLNLALSVPMFQATPQVLQRAQGVANQISRWARQNFRVDATIGLIMNNNALEAMLAPGATAVSPPPGTEGPASKMMMMARQASKTDFCTAPIAKSYNLIVAMPDGATTGGTANEVHC